ncbi:PspA/IM30 family protein [Paenibacillus koleovorans]|uniref:PspA/IM30 family protein n=1 Tax=Paenibacillus koleovorans TaxID=121608 RepID=UPI000FD824F6|nr:PspA/IM30 family protein [Paenibacillus koleovorans]
MGILSRFREIMASNWNARLDQAEDPERTLDTYMRQLNADIGQVKAETAAVLAEERRARRAWDEIRAEIDKLQRYADKAAEAGSPSESGKFLDRKVAQEEKEVQVQADYESAASNAANMKQLMEKLTADQDQLEARRTALKGKLAATKVQQSLNAMGSPLGEARDSVLDAVEDKINTAYEEAMAVAELRAGSGSSLDKEFEELEKREREQKQGQASDNKGQGE